MKREKNIGNILLFFALVSAKLCAQPVPWADQSVSLNSRPAIGGYGDFNLNKAQADFSQLPGVPDCNALYQTGSGFGPSFGVFYEMPLQNNFSLLLRGGFDLYGEKLISDEHTPIAVSGVETSGVIEHSITASLGMFGFQPMVNYHVTPAFAVHFGGEIGVVIQSSFSQIETITQPTTTGTFENGLRTRNAQAGNIPNANPIVASLIGGVSYQLPLNKSNSLQAVPELSYSFGLTPIVKNVSWTVNGFHGGVGIRYEIPEKPLEKIKRIDTIPPPSLPPPPLQTPAPIASIVATGVEANGQEETAAIMTVEEIYSTKMTPLLPYIFFADRSHSLPSRYIVIDTSSVPEFDETLLKHSDAMTINHQTLNIIGRRLTDDPEAFITLAGITMSKSKAQIDKKLALARAETAAQYLRSTWNISPERIRVTTHPLAEETVVTLDTDGIAEANRIEIASNSFDILKPVVGNDTIRTANPPGIRFHPSVTYPDAITSWQVDASQDGRVLKSFSGTSRPPAALDWILSDDPNTIPKFPGKVDFSFTVTGSHNDHTTVSGILPVEQLSLKKKKVQRMADREIEKYNLLLFDLQSSELNETNKQMIELIQKHLKEISTITIVGHTDRTGENDMNKRLSFERAKNTARALGVTKADIRGIANETVLYNNSLPEGRCLSRTVDIIVETPTDSQ